MSHSGLVRNIYRWDLVGVGINGIIGAGIFGLPAQIYSYTGSYSLLVFVVCALAVGLIVLCFAEVGTRFTETGGPYLYAFEAFGPIIAFEIGWLVWLARVTAFATICNILVDYLSYLWPPAVTGVWRTTVVSIIVTGLVSFNVLGIRFSANMSNFFAIAKLIPLLLFVIAGTFYVRVGNLVGAPHPSFGTFSHSVFLAIFTFTGFEYMGIIAGETRDPRRHLPFGLLSAVVTSALLYILIQFVCIGTLPGLGGSTRPLTDASQIFLGKAGGLVLATGATISAVGTLSIIMLTAPRLLFAMAEQGQLPRFLKSIHPRFHTPHVAILLSAVFMLFFTIRGTFIYSLTVSTIARVVTYAATCLALIVMRHNRHSIPTRFELPLGGVVAGIALTLCAWMLASSAWREARDAVIAAGAGLLLYVTNRFGQASRRLTERRQANTDIQQERVPENPDANDYS